MAANASKTPLLRLLSKRSFAASANPAVNPTTSIQVSTLPNKLVVASAESAVPGIVKVSVAFRGGSRYEREESLGASHVLRASCGLGTKNITQFAITRNLQQIGAGLSATACREAVVYTLESTSSHIEQALTFLKAVSVEQEFRPWELKDNVPRIKHELNSLPPQAVLFDLAHNAAYRKALGNSIFVREHRISCLGTETLQHFVNENFKSNRAAVAGVGIPHDQLADFANQLDMETGSGECAAAKYYGGEVRKETPGDQAYVMIAGEASSLLKKEVFAWGVLAKALGSTSQVPHGSGSSPLAKVAAAVPTSSIAAVHIPHSDSGLLGIAISSHAHYSAQAVEGVAKALNSNISDADVARGKALLKQEILSAGDSADSLLAELAYQSLLVGSVSSPSQLAAAVDSVTPAQVQDAMKKLSSCKKSMAAIGNIHNTPYLDDIQ